jgi:hypothetical protein
MRFTVRIRKLAQDPAASLRTHAARFRADATMLVVLRVKETFCPARGARPGASLHDRSQEFRIVIRGTREHASGRPADVGAIEIEADTASKSMNVLFAETRVGTAEAGKRAGGAGFHAVGE